MNLLKFFSLSIVVLLSFNNNSSAQEGWTLQRCIDHALENNLQVRQTMLSEQSAQSQRTQAMADLFPSLNASTGYNLNFGRTIDPGTNEFVTESVSSQNLWLGSSVTLFNGMRMLNTLKRSQLDVLVAEYDLQALNNDISMAIATAFLQVMFTEELLQISQDQKLISEQLEARTQKLVDAGAVARGNLYDVKAQLANDEVRVVNAENNLNSAILDLKQLLNLNSEAEFNIIRPGVDLPLTDPTTLRVSMIYNDALENWPAVLARETRVQSAIKGESIAFAGLTPTISGSASVSTLFSSSYKDRSIDSVTFELIEEDIPYGNQLDQNLSYSFGVNLSIPIFNGLQAKNGLQQARLSKLNTELQLDDTRNKLYSSIQTAHNDAIAAYRTYLASDESVKASEQAFSYAAQRYEVGMMNALDHSTSKNNLARAKSDRLRAKYDYIFRAKVLDFYRGKPLTFQLQ